MAGHSSATAREETPHVTETIPTDITIETLVEIICGAGNEAAAALLVLMAVIQSATDSNALVNTAKHFAFTHCGELNVYGMVDAEISMLHRELLASRTLVQ